MRLNFYFPNEQSFWGLLYCIYSLKTRPGVGERVLLRLLPQNKTKDANPRRNWTAKQTHGWGFLLVVVVGRVYRPTDLLFRN